MDTRRLIPPPPAVTPSPLQLAQGLGMQQMPAPQIGGPQPPPPQTIGGMINPNQAQTDLTGGIGQVYQPGDFNTTVGGGSPDTQPQIPQRTMSAPDKEDFDFQKKLRDAYDKELDAIGNAGMTKAEQRSQRALALFANIVAPAMAAFGKGGASMAGVQLMQQAKTQMQQKKAEYAATQGQHVMALRTLNDLSRIRNADFHKTVEDNIKATTAQTTADNMTFKRTMEKVTEERKAAEAAQKKIHQDNIDARGDKNAQTKADLAQSAISLNKSRGASLDAGTEEKKTMTPVKKAQAEAQTADTKERMGLRKFNADTARIGAENGQANIELKKNPPVRSASEAESVKMTGEVTKVHKQLKNVAAQKGEPEPPVEAAEEKVYANNPEIPAKNLQGLTKGQAVEKLKKYSPAYRQRIISKLKENEGK